jgi:hypothetical protein
VLAQSQVVQVELLVQVVQVVELGQVPVLVEPQE